MAVIAAPHFSSVFQQEITPCDHVVQIYRNEDALLDTLVEWVDGALGNGEVAIVIATAPHRTTLEARLRAAGHDLDDARGRGEYRALDAEATLSSFMVDGLPDERRFAEVIGGLIEAARQDGREVRAFGEMVALLWEHGQQDATMRLETLWSELCASSRIKLLCAYPRTQSTRDIVSPFIDICASHTKIAFA